MEQPRIITGSLKGRKLGVPINSRPITNRIKQSVFDTISDYVPESQVLDLFAGSGNMGFEALSRGASHCTFVDINRESAAQISETARALGVEDQCQITRLPADKYIKKYPQRFDLIFVDPPFPTYTEFSLHLLLSAMHDQTLVVLRKPTAEELIIPNSIETLYRQQFGLSEVVYLKKAA